ncbi:MAG: outer membrane lipoprotein carrier protein LolA, partial [Nitrospira sp.]|nr:outer membrane lipoprotein carrier protein LolA [Nitrospira sp.]
MNRRSNEAVTRQRAKRTVLAAVWSLASVIVAVSPASSGEEDKDVRDVVRKLQARYEQTHDLRAEFTQLTRIQGFATPIVSHGKMYIKKPGRLRWDYQDPNVEEIYVNQNDVMMYIPEHKQVLVGKLTQMAASQAPLQLLQGAANLDEQFDVDPTASGERGEGGIPLVTLRPKQTDEPSVSTVVKIVVEVQPKTYFIKRVSIH